MATAERFLLLPAIAFCALLPSPTRAAQGVNGVVTLGPNCPGPAEIGQPACDPRPYATRLAVVRAGGSRPITFTASNADGAFAVSLPPGRYEIRSQRGGLPYCKSESVVVPPGVFVNATVSCDTGMR